MRIQPAELSDAAGSNRRNRWKQAIIGSYEESFIVPNRQETICVVDDDTSVLKALGRLLSSAGLRMTGFDDPRRFLEHVKEQQVALAIIDVWMPELSGLEVQRLLRPSRRLRQSLS